MLGHDLAIEPMNSLQLFQQAALVGLSGLLTRKGRSVRTRSEERNLVGLIGGVKMGGWNAYD